ncbi:hypothetical protein BH10PSE6_BH10PSE6_18110 [soil metagenome]
MQFAPTLLPMPAQTLALSRYDVACRAVAAAKAVDDVMEIVAHADAVRVYARQAKDRQMETTPPRSASAPSGGWAS